MAIGDNIKAIRLRKGLTQKQVADACGMADSAVRAYESGRANPKPATITRIADALDVPVAELLGVTQEGVRDSLATARINASLLTTALSALLIDDGGALPIENPQKEKLDSAFEKLNDEGQQKAVERVEELTEIPRYRRQPAPEQFPEDTPEAASLTPQKLEEEG